MTTGILVRGTISTLAQAKYLPASTVAVMITPYGGGRVCPRDPRTSTQTQKITFPLRYPSQSILNAELAPFTWNGQAYVPLWVDRRHVHVNVAVESNVSSCSVSGLSVLLKITTQLRYYSRDVASSSISMGRK